MGQIGLKILQVAQVFWLTKSFKDNPILGNPVLNRVGLHVVRYLVAHALAQARMLMLSPFASKQDRTQFARVGYLAKQDFLPDETFRALEEEIRSYSGDAWEYLEGDTATQIVLLDDETRRSLPACDALIDHLPFRRLLKYCSARNRQPITFIQAIRNRMAETVPDPQKTLHSDTFHPTMKAWLFVTDVEEHDGPFTFVPGSHRVSRRRLEWEYKKSIIARELSDGHSEHGSFRASAEDLEFMNLPAPVSLPVRKNTLVVANTHGFHCRGAADPGSFRLEIFASSRTNPFDVFPGLDWAPVRRIEERLVRNFHDQLVRKPAASKIETSWRKVEVDFSALTGR